MSSVHSSVLLLPILLYLQTSTYLLFFLKNLIHLRFDIAIFQFLMSRLTDEEIKEIAKNPDNQNPQDLLDFSKKICRIYDKAMEDDQEKALGD